MSIMIAEIYAALVEAGASDLPSPTEIFLNAGISRIIPDRFYPFHKDKNAVY